MTQDVKSPEHGISICVYETLILFRYMIYYVKWSFYQLSYLSLALFVKEISSWLIQCDMIHVTKYTKGQVKTQLLLFYTQE